MKIHLIKVVTTIRNIIIQKSKPDPEKGQAFLAIFALAVN